MKHAVKLAASLAVLAVLTACDEKEPIDVSQQASVRFVNATGDVAALNFAVNGTAAAGAQNLAFGATTTCATVPVGSTSFTSSAAGGGAFGSAVTQTLTPGARYTVVAIGTAANPEYLVLSDAAGTPTAGNALLRIVNAVPGTATSDIYVTSPDATLTTATASNVGFDTSTQFVSVPAGSTEIRLTDAGTTNVTFTGTPFALQAGQTQTVIIAPGTTAGTYRTITIAPCS